jgi:hypothetical protein
MAQVVLKKSSAFTGDPIKIVVQCIERKSQNIKTGDMLQVAILPDTGRHILDIVGSGYDEAVCGSCPLRPINRAKLKLVGKEPCYVNVAKSINKVHTVTQGKLEDRDFTAIDKQVAKGRPIRLGNYGEPSLIGKRTTDRLLRHAPNKDRAHTGYTHAHKERFAQWSKAYLMASVDVSSDSLQIARSLWSRDWRTFRLIRSVDDIDPQNEILCPASKEGGNKSTCAKCLLCNGKRNSTDGRKSIAIVQHK